jgi:hypothetical protein
MLYLNSLAEATKNWGQIDPNLNDYHSDLMEISSTFWILDITDSLHQQEETNSKYTDLSNVARSMVSFIAQGVGVEDCLSLGRNVIGWRQAKTTVQTLRGKVIVRLLARVGVSNGSRPSLWVLVRVEPKPLLNWQFGLSKHPNRQLGYGSMVNSQPI